MTYHEPVTTTPAFDLDRLAKAVTDAIRADDFLTALAHLHRLRIAVDLLEPELIASARAGGASWQALAPVLGVASRQAAERRYLRLVPPTADEAGSTRDQRVRLERDRRASARAVNIWANDHTVALRRLAARVTDLDNLDPAAANDIAELTRALGDVDATALPSLLAQARRHLAGHPKLARQIDNVVADAVRIRRQTQQFRDKRSTRPI